MPKCPQCSGPLEAIRYPAVSVLSKEQWKSTCAGDWLCRKCPGNGRGWRNDNCYWWDSEVMQDKPERKTWENYFLEIAQMVATRATCPRKSVGCVLVRDRMIISSGYNGSVRGLPHCTDVGCMMEDNHCVATLHAEINAIVQAARNGVRIEGAECYVTASPCWNCFKALANAGVKRIVYGELYPAGSIPDIRIAAVAAKLGIAMVGPKE